MDNPYVELTGELNRGRLRAVLSSGQAVVLHRLAIMSKDGDWILREDDEALRHTLSVLEERGARYRFGAPLDRRWLEHGWSSHLELRSEGLRLRTDFVTRPPRLDAEELDRLWRDAARQPVPVVGLEPLAALKKTNREKDYAVIGELARRMPDPRSQFLHSRSSRDLIRLAEEHPEELTRVLPLRPLLAEIHHGRDRLERALDAERRELMRANERRLLRYTKAAEGWAAAWTEVRREIESLPLTAAHALMVSRAEGLLPFAP